MYEVIELVLDLVLVVMAVLPEALILPSMDNDNLIGSFTLEQS